MVNDLNSIKKELERKKYSVVGNSSGVQICNWTKKSLKGEGCCWKERFYGIKSHGCCQFSPSLMWCEHRCVQCWRPIELNLGTKIPEIDDPKEILSQIIEARKKLLMCFKVFEKVNKRKFKESLEPTLYTFSLAGEPTLYPRLGEMILEIRKKKAVSFLVTNGQNPSVLKRLEKESSLPTQLTLSLNAPNKSLHKIWHNSCNKDAWDRMIKSLKVIKSLKGKCRRCIRLTLVKKGSNLNSPLKSLTNMGQELISQYAELISLSDPDFVHIKGFTSIGYARYRMGADKMPWFIEVRKYAKKILKELRKKDRKWKQLGADKKSCVIILSKLNKKDMKIKILK